ncbi:hypothetical protein ACP5PY_18120 [Photobacterium leiognathi subsp. mandapamensis]
MDSSTFSAVADCFMSLVLGDVVLPATKSRSNKRPKQALRSALSKTNFSKLMRSYAGSGRECHLDFCSLDLNACL